MYYLEGKCGWTFDKTTEGHYHEGMVNKILSALTLHFNCDYKGG